MWKAYYRILVEGKLDSSWDAWFSGWHISHPDPETTLLHSGPIDQAALYGVIRKICDLNLPILELNCKDRYGKYK